MDYGQEENHSSHAAVSSAPETDPACNWRMVFLCGQIIRTLITYRIPAHTNGILKFCKGATACEIVADVQNEFRPKFMMY